MKVVAIVKPSCHMNSEFDMIDYIMSLIAVTVRVTEPWLPYMNTLPTEYGSYVLKIKLCRLSASVNATIW